MIQEVLASSCHKRKEKETQPTYQIASSTNRVLHLPNTPLGIPKRPVLA